MSGLRHTLGNLISKITSSKAVISDKDKESALNLSINVMALVSVADGQIDQAEVKLVQDVYFDRIGNLVEPATIENAFRIVVGNRDTVWRNLHAAHKLDEQLRRDIFQTAVEVAAADQDLHTSELELLRQVGNALGLAPDFVERRLGAAGGQ